MTQIPGLRLVVFCLSVFLSIAAVSQSTGDVGEAEISAAEPEPTSKPTTENRSQDADENPVITSSSARFEPSEEVSEDLSISFPADI